MLFFEGRGTYLMGAAQFLFPEEMKNFWNIADYAQEGYRSLFCSQ
ncbi:MAG: hypothetical protein ACLVB1_05100 [Blautia obeum]